MSEKRATVRELDAFLTPQQAWEQLWNYRERFYRRYAAEYSGQRLELNATSYVDAFWRRAGKCKLHIPIAADIAATSAALLFGEEPRFTCYDESTEDEEPETQKRLDDLLAANNVHALLSEAAESCAVMGDVFLKLNLMPDEVERPILTVAQADSAWAEYTLGVLKCVHFFTLYKTDLQKNHYYRLYERYERGKIMTALFKGSADGLGKQMPEAALEELGFATETVLPVNELLAVHIPNSRPNKIDRQSMLGRSDFEGLRDSLDALDETYTSWMRDVRLAKARLIVPVEYLRRKPHELLDENSTAYTYEFDEDVETLVALDVNTDHNAAITPSQFAIRSAEHAATCYEWTRKILAVAGYSPQTFGLDIEGQAQSGTALHIREKKSYQTIARKQEYWQPCLEKILTAMVHLDAAFFPQYGSQADDEVKMSWADAMSADLATTSAALAQLNGAAAVSTEIKVAMLHPDWTAKQLAEETMRVKAEHGMLMPAPDMLLGDLEGENQDGEA